MSYTPPQPVKLQSDRVKKYQRTGADVGKALGALVVLAALLVGIPLALVQFIGWPLPHQLPTMDALSQPLDAQTVLKALAVVVWLAWAQFTACVVVEIINARRGFGIPTKIPGAGLSQFLARQLVAALLMLTATAASFAPDIAHLGSIPAAAPRTQQSISVQYSANGSQASSGTHALGASSGNAAASSTGTNNLPSLRGSQALATPASGSMTQIAVDSTAGTKLYRVEPPDGRSYDSLWEIAQRHLGDGRRYKEIFDLNKDRVQPDGSKLTEASLIRPGWYLEMPGDATGGDLITEMPPAPALPAPAPSGPSAQASASQGSASQGSAAQGSAGQGSAVQGGSGSQGSPDQAGTVGTLGNGVTVISETSGQSASDPLATTENQPQNQQAQQEGGPQSDEPDGATQPAGLGTGADSGSRSGTGSDEPTSPSKLTPANPQGVKVSQAAEEIAHAVAAAAARAAAEQEHPAAAGQPVPIGQSPTSHRGDAHADERELGPVQKRVLYGIAGAPLMAAGLLLALGRHRRRQLWNRIGGRRPATPTGDAAVAEESIRVGAADVEVWFLDLALRGLSAELFRRNLQLPHISGLRMHKQGVELMLAPAVDQRTAEQAPLPWFTAAGGRSWVFPRPAIGQIDADTAHQRFAPYPGLVSLGASLDGEDDRVLIDLEDARGVFCVAGPREHSTSLICAMAVELATNAWSDRMSVTLVGFPGDLTPLAPARVRHVKVLDEILPELEAEAADRAAALSSAGLDSVLDSRVRASQASAFPPHFVLVAEEPHPAILSRLIEIAPSTARVGMGFVVAGDVEGAAGRLEVTEDGLVYDAALGIEAIAQLLPLEQYSAILGLFQAVGDIEGVPLNGTGGVTRVAEDGFTGPLPDEQPAVFVRVLGELETIGTGMAEPERAPQLHEALVFLLQHRDGVHPSVLAAALWPRGTTAEVARSTFERLGEWLGTDLHDMPNLVTDPDGRLRLGRYVWSDWDLFESLCSRALYDASLQVPVHLDNLLSAALDLVRGKFLANRAKGRYGWLAYEIVEAQIPAQIADTALRLADARIANGAAEKAIAAVEAGLRASPEDEELWRGLIRAVFATGDVPRLDKTIAALRDRTWRVHGVKELHPRTEALIEELAPASAINAS